MEDLINVRLLRNIENNGCTIGAKKFKVDIEKCLVLVENLIEILKFLGGNTLVFYKHIRE